MTHAPTSSTLFPYTTLFRSSKSSLIKFKSQPGIFETLLAQSKKITIPPDDMGIIFKGEFAKHKVIKVCSPYCGPCSEIHPILEKDRKSTRLNSSHVKISYAV